MCNAFSCIVTRNRKVYWKTGLDSHNDIVEKFNLKDEKKGVICPIEITPDNNDYVNPDKWTLHFDDGCPDWWKQSHEKASYVALEKWKKEVYSKLHLNRIKNIIHPFKLPIVKKVNKSQIKLLKQWDSVRNSVRDPVFGSVRDSVWNSVWDSVGGSVWDSVRDSVWDSVSGSVWGSVRGSVWDSVWCSVGAYIGYMFNLKRSEWKYTDKIKCKGYPFMPLVKLWNQGLVPSFDGSVWRLHSGKKAKVVFEIKKEDLLKL